MTRPYGHNSRLGSEPCQHCRGKGYQPVRGNLTRRQAELYRYLVAYSEQHGYAPSFEEIAEHFNYNSLATVHEHLATLERKAFIARRYNEARAITCLVPLVEMAGAG